MATGKLHAAHAGKGHLLLDVVAEPLTADGIAVNDGDGGAEEQSPVEHGLQREAAVQGERHAPRGADVAEAGMTSEGREVVGEIGVVGLEARATGGEIPVVLAVEVHLCAVADVVVVVDGYGGGMGCEQFVAEVEVVPADTHAHVEVADAYVDGQQFGLVVVVEDAVVAVALVVDVDVVAAEHVGEHGAGEVAGMEGQVGASHQSLAQPHGEVDVGGQRRLQREVGVELQGHHLLVVKAEAHAQLTGLAVARREDDAATVAVGHAAHADALVEQVGAQRRGDALLQPGVGAVLPAEVELLADEALVVAAQVLELESRHPHALRHGLRTAWHEPLRTERAVDADALLQGQQFVPVPQGLLLAAPYQRVVGDVGEAGGIVARGVHADGYVGNAEVVVVLVLAVHVHYLVQYAHGAAQVFSCLGSPLHGDADNDVGPHPSGDVGRIVVAQPTVHQHHVADANGREYGGDGHRGPHGLRQTARVEVVLGVGDDVRRHAGKRDGRSRLKSSESV